jgi:predicted dehydrogenase
MINYATIGTGWITSSWIASAASTAQWNLVGVYSRSSESAQSFAQKHNASKTYTSLEALSADGDIDAVYIASPNNLHFAHSRQILEAGKHVIVEKPASSSADEWNTLVTLAKSKNVYIIEAFRHIHERNFRILQSSLSKLGDIYGASLTYASYSSRYNNVLAGETPNIFNLQYNGGSLVDLGVYPIAAAVALFGAPKSATYKPFIIRTGADGGGFILLSYESFGVQINASKIYTSVAPSEVYGEKGTLRINGVTDLEYVRFLDAKTKEVVELGGQKEELNLKEEAVLYAKIVGGKESEEEYERLCRVSNAVVNVTEGLRKEVGLTFPDQK